MSSTEMDSAVRAANASAATIAYRFPWANHVERFRGITGSGERRHQYARFLRLWAEAVLFEETMSAFVARFPADGRR